MIIFRNVEIFEKKKTKEILFDGKCSRIFYFCIMKNEK